MKNSIKIMAACYLMMAQTAFSQNINLTFKGEDTDGKYVQMDSVRIENISRSWTETLIYPDTVLTLVDETGVSEVESNSLKCLSYPNPCNGRTNVMLSMEQEEAVTLQVYNLEGQQMMEKRVRVAAGENHFEISLDRPQVYFLVTHTAQGQLVQKLINTGISAGNSITYIGSQEIGSAKTQKLLSSKLFRPGDVLKMTAYATLHNTLVVSKEIQQSQTESEALTMVFALPLFSVAYDKQVVFSPGNLQWSANNGGNTATTHAVAGNGTAAGTWRFAPNQWDTICFNNKLVSPTYTGWIDLFGWGTSGYNNKYPYMNSTSNADYGYGSNHIAGTNYDWGVYNAIFNPKTQTTDAPGTWRGLTEREWVYLVNSRNTPSGIRYAKAVVGDVNGLIIVPDNWSNTIYALDSTNIKTATCMSNIINATDWTKMETAGCVFLPTAGFRDGNFLYNAGSYGYYWSTTYINTDVAYYLSFGSTMLNPSGNNYHYAGHSVRLVKDVE